MQKGLDQYIKKFAYNNAATEDLWGVLSDVSGEPVRELMNSWTSQKGFPVLTAKVNGNSVELGQVCVHLIIICRFLCLHGAASCISEISFRKATEWL